MNILNAEEALQISIAAANVHNNLDQDLMQLAYDTIRYAATKAKFSTNIKFYTTDVSSDPVDDYQITLIMDELKTKGFDAIREDGGILVTWAEGAPQ